MKELRVYGDSFTASFSDDKNDNHNWTYMLAKKLGYQEVNRAVSGGSNAAIYYRLYEDIKKNVICNNKTGAIIVQLSTNGRFYNDWVLKNYPQGGSLFLHAKGSKFKEFIPSCADSLPYYVDNKDHINWWFAENNLQLEDLGVETFLHWLKYSLAKKYSNVKIIVMFNTVYPNTDFSHLENTENFLCFNNVNLSKISSNEYSNSYSYSEFTKYTIIDPRVNHFCNPNLELLASAIFKIIHSNETSVLSEDIFMKDIITRIEDKEQYKKYVEKDIISLNSNVLHRM